MNDNCSLCKQPTSFERRDLTQPLEGDVCSICGAWVCPACIDWLKMTLKNTENIICKLCSTKEGL
jgi:hypothetical protein